MARLGVSLAAVALAAAACGPTVSTRADEGQPTSTATTVAVVTTTITETTTTQPLIDTQAILDRYGFELCGDQPQEGDVTPERAQEIFDLANETGIVGWAGLGSKVTMTLKVLDERSLAVLAEIAGPSEICVSGQDPNDYVEPGPQTFVGAGWRWVGAGNGVTNGSFSLITRQSEYDELWPLLGEGPETEQIPVDFEREAILAISHGSGVSFGSCGARVDGVFATSDGIVVDWFRPGGDSICPAIGRNSTYAIAIDLEFFGQPPFEVGLRHGPRAPVKHFQTVSAGSFAVTTTAPPQPDPPPTTTIPPTTLPPVVPETAAPLDVVFAEGELSVPLAQNRIGGIAVGFDAPLLPEWVEQNWGSVITADVVGRGTLTVEEFSANDDAWKFAVAPNDGYFVEAGPTALAVPTYTLVGQEFVSTGSSLAGQEYRYQADDSVGQHVIRWFERGDRVVVVKLGYPDPEVILRMIPDPDDTSMHTLTGYSPEQILDDIRFFD